MAKHNMKYGLSEEQLGEIVNKIKSHKEIEEAVLFGSRAIDTYKEASDIDIALKGKEISSALAAKLNDYFEEESYLPFFLDFLSYSDISNKELKKEIDTRGIVIFSNNTIPNGWRRTTLGEIAEINMGQSPKSIFYNKENMGLPFLQGSKTFGLKYPSLDTYCTKPTKVARKGEVLFSVRAPVGDINIASTDLCIGRGLASFNSKQNTNIFLYFLLHHIKDKIVNVENGSVFGSVGKNDLSMREILLPPLSEQKAIAEVLSSLDDKIELLHRQNKTLEDIAQTIFQERCIKETDEKWKTGKLGDIADIASGKRLKKNEYKTKGEYPILGANGEIARADGYLLDERVIYTGRVGTLGNVFISNTKVWITDNTLIIKPIKEYFYFTYFLLKTLNLKSMNVGSTQPLIRQSDLQSLEITLPEKSIIQEYKKQTENIFTKIDHNQSQIYTLGKLRDTILPKLMRGKLRVV